ncbi:MULTISPECIES: hypothetical protein [unclassified Streptomyces]|uniref:hypothetical protein n=1 Tax=unclassified Streptomyces TaxID=2593676 RepID=UPI0023B8E36D|nr:MULTISPECIES: hypothetical protein [unclassified Streptomyces]
MYKEIHRGFCLYSMTSAHGYAQTTKDRPNCNGHAWLYVQTKSGWKSGWKHNAERVTITAPANDPIKHSWHKTQRNETARHVAH